MRIKFMEIKLENIVQSIKYGPHFSSSGAGEVRYLKGAHFDEEFELTDFEGSYVGAEESFEKYLLVENDIIIAAKGGRNYAWKYSEEEGPCVPSSLFFVMKINTEIVESGYLALVLNSPRVQHKLKAVSMGGTISVIPRGELLRLKIAIPPKEKQKQIIKLNKLMKQQIKIEREILNNKIDLKNGLINLLTKPKKE